MPLRIVAAALLTYAVSTATGEILLSRLKLRLSRGEWWFLAFLTGSACLSTLVFLLANLRWVYPGSLLALSAVLLGLRIGLVGRWRGHWSRRASLGRDARVETSLDPADTSVCAVSDLDWRWKTAFWGPYFVFGIY